MTHYPVPLVEELLVVASGALRKTRQDQNFRGETHCYIVPDGRVQALCAVLIPVALCLYAAEALNLLLERDQ